MTIQTVTGRKFCVEEFVKLLVHLFYIKIILCPQLLQVDFATMLHNFFSFSEGSCLMRLLVLEKFRISQIFALCKFLAILKFVYSEKATKLCEIFPLLLTVCTAVKSKGKISQNFVAFSEYMNFNKNLQLA